MLIPKKIQAGDHIRVVSPSKSFSILSKETVDIALQRLSKLGFTVSISQHASVMDDFGSSSIEERIEDLHDAFADESVDNILTTIGGHNCNQLLKYLDYNLIKQNPKVLVGYSDITALANAIYTKTGLVTYSGPHFSTFGMKKGMDYTIDYFRQCLMMEDSFTVNPSTHWSDDEWYLDQENRIFHENRGWSVIQEGEAEGVSIGGNLCTLNLLQGTEYMPSLEDSILFIEDDYLTFPENFDRDLQSLIHQSAFEGVKGILIGRFQRKSGVTDDLLKKIIASKKELRGLPILANVDFGHTSPMFTFPIGGRVKMEASKGKSSLVIQQH
ncbi:LD-carboxypeptidase [Shimazuella sp. AN120528]|uniref:S66 family peptidase n=1 Tax=Shimazuella soli TaxID=1892854 RepID=UPI001F0E1594|nr:S66 peptidase family protein [Shimazuella soli]MCH5586365.1 LD-carboxypeptidase [Shimazuella soli]